MNYTTYTVEDTGSGFQAEHVELLAKLEIYKQSIVALRFSIAKKESEKARLTTEIAMFQDRGNYLAAKSALISKVIEVDEPDILLIPDENNNTLFVIFGYAE
jgi:hypothetical protein